MLSLMNHVHLGKLEFELLAQKKILCQNDYAFSFFIPESQKKHALSCWLRKIPAGGTCRFLACCAPCLVGVWH